jgi:predicted metal-dependent TIM-barrel fold hydrolase
MRFIDPHLHTDMIEDADLEKLVMAGLEAAVIPSPHMFLGGPFSAEALLRLWRRFLEFEVKSAKTLGFEAFVTLSIPFYGLTLEAVEECLKALPEYLKHERVVGMGEIGLDVGIEDEAKLFRAQLKLAKEHNLPIIIHSPIRLAPQAPTVIKQIVNVIKEENFSLDRVILDHTGESTLDFRLNSGAMVGLSVCWDKMPPEVAAEIVLKHPDKRDKLVINSELGYGKDGYFSIPRVILAMKRLGLKSEEIEKVTFENPKKFFNLPIG